MNVDRIVTTFAGLMVLVSIALTHYVHPDFFFLTAFVGINLFIAGVTKFCLLAVILKKIGVTPGSNY